MFTLSVNVLVGQQPLARHASPGFNWPKTLAEMQAADRMKAVSLEPFLNELRPLYVPALQVGEFRFVPMEGTTICLAATVDARDGREFFYPVAVVCPVPEGSAFRMTILPSTSPHSLGAELVDLDGDGNFEIITRELAGGYQGARTLPLYWYSVFRVKDSVPHDVSANYKAFYVEHLLMYLDLISELAAPAGATPAGRAAEVLADARFLMAKYERRIVGNPEAGFDEAVQWGNTDDYNLQMLAVRSFRDMDSPKALAELKKLAKAKNGTVSQAATLALEAKGALRR